MLSGLLFWINISFIHLQLILLASTTMTIFLRTKMHRDTIVDGIVYLGALFFGVIVAMFNGISELNLAIMKLPVFYKQRDLLFYPSWAYSISTWILKIPISIVEAAIWVFMTYYVIGFDPSVERWKQRKHLDSNSSSGYKFKDLMKTHKLQVLQTVLAPLLY